MPNSSDDVFYVIDYTNQQILEGGIHQLMTLDGHIMRSLAYLNQQLGALMNAVADGVVVEELVEIYTVMRIEDNPYDDRFQDTVFMNDVALRLCRKYGVRLTPVVAKTTRGEMPAAPSLLMKKRVYTLKVDAGVSPERIPAFRVGDYVRPRGGGKIPQSESAHRRILARRADRVMASPNGCRSELHQQAGEGPLREFFGGGEHERPTHGNLHRRRGI